MKLSVSAFRAQASAQRKILSSYQNQLNYGACSTFPASSGIKVDEVPQMMVDKTGIGPSNTQKPNDQSQSSENSAMSSQDEEDEDKVGDDKEEHKEKDGEKERIDNRINQGKHVDEGVTNSDKSPGGQRTKSNQRWMKLRTTVQLSGAISSTIQKSKPPLKREDSFLKRFSTRQIPETQETVDTGDETEPTNGVQTQDEVNRRRRKRRKQLSRTVVNPDENFFFYWLMMVTVCVLYNLWTLIVRQSFPELQSAASAFWYAADGLTDLVFVCDIVVQFRTGYLEQGLMVYDSKKLAGHYLKSRAFIFDLLSLLPLDLLQINIGVNPILRFPRFLKIYRVYNYYYIVESRTVYPNLWRVVNLIHILLILAHWFGCFYYLLSEAEDFKGDWVYPYRAGDYATLTRKYLGSLYWSTLTLTTIGDLPTPETNAESRDRSKAMTPPGDSHPLRRRGHKSRLLQFNSNYGYVFTIVSYLIGVFIFATIVGQVGNVITNRNANRLEFERLLDGAKTYMRHHKVPGGMKRRVLRWYDYSWSRGRIQGGGDINTALGLLPDKLKTELALHVNLSVLKKVTIFQECQPEFLHDLVLKMKAYIFTPGDLICRKGEVAREMFIIADGILDVISENGRVLTTMKAGDFFGEIGILNLDGLNKRTADVRSVGYSELFSLSREDVLSAMKDYPEAQEILQSLGRKRLMEAKNASKMHKAQVKQVKDHDSSGDSDTAGKRIVEKLRSDVKGLKNALRRSRRGTRTKDGLEGGVETTMPKISDKKHCILRRMSHVQSSDEYEINNDVAQSPIGAGLPLLQRLKMLKEKQEKEKEEKEKAKPPTSDPPPSKIEGSPEPEVIGAGLPLMQRLKLLKQREERESAASAASAAAVPSSTPSQGDGMGNLSSSTVRTQLPGLRFDKSLSKSKLYSTGGPGDMDIQKIEEELKTSEENDSDNDTPPTAKKSDNIVTLREKLKLLHSAQSKEKATPLKNAQVSDSTSISPSSRNILLGNIQPETSNNVPINIETANTVPKPVESKSEVPKSKDSWGILKRSSIRGFKTEKKPLRKEEKPVEEEKLVRKVSSKGTYLSKSDTVLEKQLSVEKNCREKRSRSISPSECQKRTWKATVENLIRERRRTKSLSQASRKMYDEIVDVNAWEFPEAAFKNLDPPENVDMERGGEDSKTMKKYDSIDDLSPEYSGLPFVKKLKILNERQKLAALEKELVVRSSSLDVPERTLEGDETLLIRSQSEASAIEIKKTGKKSRTPPSESWRNVAASSSGSSKSTMETKLSDPPVEAVKRSDTVIEQTPNKRTDSEGSLASPESNETMERRHLKSILKKLSAEESASDEDQCSKNIKRTMSLKKSGHDIKKLMRAPTVEGYAARHTKLTKSVTFNRDTLQSPPGSSPLEPAVEETIGKAFSPTSPTAILTLQLSNLSMIPIASPTKPEGIENLEKPIEGPTQQLVPEEKIKITEVIIPKVLEKLQEEAQKFALIEQDKGLPLVVQEISDRRCFRMLPYSKSQDEEYFGAVGDVIKQVIQGHFEDMQKKFESQFQSLEMEVKKRDDIISQLQSKIQELETPLVKSALVKTEKSEDGNTDSGGTDPELSDVPFLRGDSFETILGVTSPQGEPSSISTSPLAPVLMRSRGCSPIVIEELDLQENVSELNETNQQSDSDTPFDYLGNVIRHDDKPDTSENDENEDDLFDIRDKIRLLSNTDRTLKRRFRTPWDPQSDEELELLELPKKPKSESGRSYGTESRLKRNYSIDETSEPVLKNRQRRRTLDITRDETWDKFDNKRYTRPRGSIINRVSELGRSFSRSSESRDFVALDIDDSSSSSDLEDPHNKDWEIQMLAEELNKKEKSTKEQIKNEEEEDDDFVEEVDSSLDQLEEMKRLEDEVKKLKQVVCESDLSQLSNSELDLLESIIEAKDQKIAQIAKSSSFDSRNESFDQKQLKHLDSSGSDHSRRSDERPKEVDQRRRTSLKQKIGQAFSFDFHDIDNRKRKSPHEYGKRKSFSLRKQKTISSSYQEHQSLDNLLHTSSFLRNRVLEDSTRTRRNKNNSTSSTINSRSSLPILVSKPGLGKLDIRTSLPTLSAKEGQQGTVKPNLSECVTSSISSSDDTFQESDFKESCDSVFEENAVFRDSNHLESETLLEFRNINYPTTSKPISPTDAHSNKSLNNFIKSVGQKVKQAVVGDAITIKDQVPTISKLCDDQSIFKQTDVACSDEILVRDPMVTPEEEVKVADDDSSQKVLDSLDNNPRTDPPDL